SVRCTRVAPSTSAYCQARARARQPADFRVRKLSLSQRPTSTQHQHTPAHAPVSCTLPLGLDRRHTQKLKETPGSKTEGNGNRKNLTESHGSKQKRKEQDGTESKTNKQTELRKVPQDSRRFYRMPRPGRDRDAVCQHRADMTTIERDEDGNVAKCESDYGSSTAKHTKAKSRTEYMSARGSISTKVTLNMYLMSYE